MPVTRGGAPVRESMAGSGLGVEMPIAAFGLHLALAEEPLSPRQTTAHSPGGGARKAVHRDDDDQLHWGWRAKHEHWAKPGKGREPVRRTPREQRLWVIMPASLPRARGLSRDSSVNSWRRSVDVDVPRLIKLTRNPSSPKRRVPARASRRSGTRQWPAGERVLEYGRPGSGSGWPGGIQRVRHDVELYGWHVVMIRGDQEPGFLFTIGLWQSYRHPEIGSVRAVRGSRRDVWASPAGCGARHEGEIFEAHGPREPLRPFLRLLPSGRHLCIPASWGRRWPSNGGVDFPVLQMFWLPTAKAPSRGSELLDELYHTFQPLLFRKPLRLLANAITEYPTVHPVDCAVESPDCDDDRLGRLAHGVCRRPLD